MTLLTMLFLAPLLGLMPHAVLAGIVIVYSVGLIQPANSAISSRFAALNSSGRWPRSWA